MKMLHSFRLSLVAVCLSIACLVSGTAMAAERIDVGAVSADEATAPAVNVAIAPVKAEALPGRVAFAQAPALLLSSGRPAVRQATASYSRLDPGRTG